MIRNLISKAPIVVTDKAWIKLKDIANKSDISTFLFSAKSGGCNGFNYLIENIKDDFDKEKTNYIKNENIKMYVDPFSEMLLLNTTIDFVEEDYKKGNYGSKFVFIPDKDFATSCGCGVSFAPK